MNKGIWYALAAIVIVVVIVIFAVSGRGDVASTTPTPTSTPEATATESALATETPAPASSSTATRTPTSGGSLTYSQAVDKYKNARMQFDDRCQASPAAMQVKAGSSVMFDNRSGDARKFNIGGVSYNIAGFGFLILPMKGTGTVAVDCGSAQNVARITIQK